ncbi:N-acetyltransferase [Corynebacterium yudongzhengii]|uniref:N-acetyltransferase n=1 Tax=Corynebacterium yudongzhengii TaxID=2080740 RepID=A0A2U1T5V6_9CORY|nr:GNAT family N-acetyltransferase [Corynebacterium yudongzhengii]AWB82575.1 N-acetyltransferase [Corynebacterium yudongzhengii]PWC01355.1 N-acetyltransferase [Corynebacterium yudongzhengii]
MTRNSETSVIHDEENSRYLLQVGEQTAGFAAYRDNKGVRDFNHTVVYPRFRGQGLSGRLIGEALDDTRALGRKVVASCSAVQHFVDKHEGYRDLLA